MSEHHDTKIAEKPQKSRNSSSILRGIPSLQTDFFWTATTRPFQTLSRQVMGLILTVLVVMKLNRAQGEEPGSEYETPDIPKSETKSVRFDMAGSFHQKDADGETHLENIPDLEASDTAETDPTSTDSVAQENDDGKVINERSKTQNKSIVGYPLVLGLLLSGGSFYLLVWALFRFLVLGDWTYPSF